MLDSSQSQTLHTQKPSLREAIHQTIRRNALRLLRPTGCPDFRYITLRNPTLRHDMGFRGGPGKLANTGLEL